MKQLTIIISLLITLLICSCKDKYPSTIIGIRLGKNAKNQIDSAISSSKLIEDKARGLHYFKLSDNIIGYPKFYDFLFNEQGEYIMCQVNVEYATIVHQVPFASQTMIYKNDKDCILESYKNKYGEPNSSNYDSIKHWLSFHWKKDLLNIEMSIQVYDATNYFPELYYCQVIYSLDANYLDELREKSNRSNRIEKNI